MRFYNGISACGVLGLLLIAWVFSAHRKCLNWRAIGIGLGLQLILGLLLFTVPAGARVFTAINSGVISVLDSAGQGARFVFTLRAQFPNIAGHLVSASLLSAPAALVMAKILLPETETPETLGLHVTPYYDKENNLFEAIINPYVRCLLPRWPA